ncbi:MAG: glycosyltransferase [Deltaproteobacteria bacterium]|nr:glycosyltransferase [Deltaproteobacteria bacterium]
MPRRVLLHVSNHGFGHAARCGVLARALMDTGEVERLVVAVPRSYARFFEGTAQDPRVSFLDVETDLGIPLAPGEFEPDARRVARALDAWVSSFERLLEESVAALGPRPPDLVVVDASALGCELAARIGAPAVVVSNFEWHAQYVGLGLSGPSVERIRRAYASVRLFLRYPFFLPSDALAHVPTRDVPACTRRPDPVEAARIASGLPSPRVLFTLGGLITLCTPIRLERFRGSVIFTQGIAVEAPRAARVVDLSASGTNMQSYLGAADLVVTKAGWSTVAEAAAARKPLLVVRRPGVPEDKSMLAGLEARGLARGVDLGEVPGGLMELVESGLAPTPGLPCDPDAVARECLSLV